MFKTYLPQVKRKIVMDAKRCLDCLSIQHFVRDCPYPSKCRKCGSGYQNKHFGALQECYGAKIFGVAELTAETEPLSTGDASGRNLTAHKIKSAESRSILLRSTAVKIGNPVSYTLISQSYTLIFDSLRNKLRSETKTDHSVVLRTLTDKSANRGPS